MAVFGADARASDGRFEDRARTPAIQSSLAPHSLVLDVTTAGKRMVAVGERGHILLSDDGGGSWRQVYAPVSVTLTGVAFADERTGWAIGHRGVVLGTEDGGETWTAMLDGGRAAALTLEQARLDGDEDAIFLADRLVKDGPDKPFLTLLVSRPRTVTVLGAYGLAARSMDGGKTWVSWASHMDNPAGWHLNAIAAEGATELVAGEQGTLLLSEDGGGTFSALESPYDGSFFGALSNGKGRFLILGLRGHAFLADRDLLSWTACSVASDASLTDGLVLPDGRLAAVTASGDLLVGTADCSNLSPVPGLPPMGPLAALALSPGETPALVLAGVSGLHLVPLSRLAPTTPPTGRAQ